MKSGLFFFYPDQNSFCLDPVSTGANLRCHHMVRRRTLTWSYMKMTSQLSADFNKVWFPPLSIPPPSTLPFHVSAYLQTWARLIRTYQSRSGQRGGLPQSERSVSQPAVPNGDKKKKRGRKTKSLFSENTIPQSACVSITNVRRKNIVTVSYFGKAYFLSGWTRGFPQLSRSLQSHLYKPACREEHANTFHRFLERRGKTELDFFPVHAFSRGSRERPCSSLWLQISWERKMCSPQTKTTGWWRKWLFSVWSIGWPDARVMQRHMVNI